MKKRVQPSSLDCDKCYPGHDPEQHPRSFNYCSNTFDNADGAVIFKLYITQST